MQKRCAAPYAQRGKCAHNRSPSPRFVHHVIRCPRPHTYRRHDDKEVRERDMSNHAVQPAFCAQRDACPSLAFFHALSAPRETVAALFRMRRCFARVPPRCCLLRDERAGGMPSEETRRAHAIFAPKRAITIRPRAATRKTRAAARRRYATAFTLMPH